MLSQRGNISRVAIYLRYIIIYAKSESLKIATVKSAVLLDFHACSAWLSGCMCLRVHDSEWTFFNRVATAGPQ